LDFDYDNDFNTLKVLKLTFDKYTPPVSTEPLGACATSAEATPVTEAHLLNVGKCFSVKL
jgi:hypothetical protein